VQSTISRQARRILSTRMERSGENVGSTEISLTSESSEGSSDFFSSDA
jgi:hypothetical protein